MIKRLASLITLIITVTIVMALGGGEENQLAEQGNDSRDVISNHEENAYLHFYEQMDWYKEGSDLRLIQSYVGTTTRPADYTAWVYDNDLAIIALIDKGTPEDMSRAKILCDALIWAQNHDHDFKDGRIRDGYWASNLSDSSGKYSSIKSPGSGTGNMAWTIIALLRYYEVTENNMRDRLR